MCRHGRAPRTSGGGTGVRALNCLRSQLVLDEAAAGHAEAAERRLRSLAGIPILPVTDAASELAVSLLKEGALPEKAADDALHLAIAAYHGVDYLPLGTVGILITPR